MESALSPREIQTRIRSGESVDDVARVAGVERDRVERFAAPVIAEREHVAGLAMTSSARRRGETSSHRTLRGVLNERLLNRGVDIDTVRWDSYRLDDGRWAVTADYLSGDTPKHAVFYFDVPGRYSVAGNDEGRWVLRDTSSSRGPQPSDAGGPEDGTEPTIDLSDELALVRAIQDVPVAGPPAGRATGQVEVTEVEVTIAEVVQLNRASDGSEIEAAEPEAEAPEAEAPDAHATEAGVSDAELAEVEAELDRLEAAEQSASGLDVLSEIFDDQDPYAEVADGSAPDADESPASTGDPEAAEPTVEVRRGAVTGEEPDHRSRLVADSAPSDASAVPELSLPLQPDAWEPAIVVDYPIEPSEDSEELDGYEVPEGSDDPGRPEAAVAREDRQDEAASLFVPRVVSEPDEPAAGPETDPDPIEPAVEVDAEAPVEVDVEVTEVEVTEVEAAATEDDQVREAADDQLPLDLPEQPATAPATPKPTRRKRASVPSWDEIVFGGPKDK